MRPRRATGGGRGARETTTISDEVGASTSSGQAYASSLSADGSPSTRIGWQGWGLIVCFWTLYGFVMTASLFAAPIGRRPDVAHAAIMAFTFFGAYTWAALTVPIFHLTHRFGLTADRGTCRVFRIAGLVALGVALSLFVSVGLAYLSAVLLQNWIGRLADPGGVWIMTRYRVLFDLLACQLVLTAGIARDYFLRYQSRLAEATRLRTRLVEAELQVLRTQLNPHFLFNTLNSVAALVQTDPRGVRRMIALLSDLLRSALATASEPEVTLQHELEMLRCYLDIMEIRFRGRLQAKIDVDSTLLDGMVPHLILQPLVENAVKHGVSLSSGPSSVHVKSVRDQEQMVLTVTNTSPEEPRSRGRHRRSGGTAELGLGLRNTRQRLRQLYGDEGSLRLGSTERGRWIAEVRLPYHTDPVSLGPALSADDAADAKPISPMDGAA